MDILAYMIIILWVRYGMEGISCTYSLEEAVVVRKVCGASGSGYLRSDHVMPDCCRVITHLPSLQTFTPCVTHEGLMDEHALP
jgi:hypothetical protein